MKVQANTAPLLSYTNAAARVAQQPASPTTTADTVEVQSSGLARGSATAGGALAGAAASAVSNVAFVVATKALLQLVAKGLPAMGASPAVSHVLDQAVSLTTTAEPGLLLAAGALGAFQGAKAGGAVAYQAATGATKLDLAKNPPPQLKDDHILPLHGIKDGIHNLLEAHREDGAELRERLGGLAKADSFGSAAAQGAEAANCLLAPSGGAAGKVQGALFGFLAGGAAALPLMSAVPHVAILLPTAIAGAFMGAKLGPHVGYAANSLAGGLIGGVGGAAYHAVTRGHHGE